MTNVTFAQYIALPHWATSFQELFAPDCEVITTILY